MIDENKMKLIEDLDKIIEEGQEIEDFKGSKAWTIILTTLKAQVEAYESECFEAASKSDKEIRNYLGRIEAVKNILELIENRFSESMHRAIEQKNAINKEITEQDQIDSSAQEHIEGSTYPGSSPGFV